MVLAHPKNTAQWLMRSFWHFSPCPPQKTHTHTHTHTCTQNTHLWAVGKAVSARLCRTALLQHQQCCGYHGYAPWLRTMATKATHHGYAAWLPRLRSMATMATHHGYAPWLPRLRSMGTMATQPNTALAPTF